MYYGKKLDSPIFLIKITIKLNNKLYKLAIKKFYSNSNSKVRLYKEYTSY